jgi:hypothetical protein
MFSGRYLKESENRRCSESDETCFHVISDAD